jgi:hypothetical protein
MNAIKKITCLVFTVALTASVPTVFAADENNATKTHYKKLNATGKPANAKPGDALCVLDNQTGLVWELKTDDDGVHDKDKTYRWGGRGAEQIGEKFFDDWNALIDGSNSEKLCGFSDWRVPTIDELKTLVAAGANPAIDTSFFPLTLAKPYWSVSAYKNYPEHGQTVHFETGASYYYNGYRGDSLPLRLVRGAVK